MPGTPVEIWEFSFDNEKEGNPVVSEIHQAEKSGERAVVDELPDAVERLLRERVWGASRELVGAAL